MTARLLGLIAVIALLPSCGVAGLNFFTDDRVEILTPEDRAEVRLPLTITWKAERFEITGPDGASRDDAGYFGVYVDRVPQPPGQTQEWIVRDDPDCTGACPDEAYLAGLNIFSTTETSFTVERLPVPTGAAAERRDLHDVTIALLDGRGARIGESAFTIQFEVAR